MKIAPSILGCDFARLKEETDSVAGSDYLHVDVMDGMFVPIYSIGIPVVESLSRATDIPLDVHLMITKPERYAERFVKAGASHTDHTYRGNGQGSRMPQADKGAGRRTCNKHKAGHAGAGRV